MREFELIVSFSNGEPLRHYWLRTMNREDALSQAYQICTDVGGIDFTIEEI